MNKVSYMIINPDGSKDLSETYASWYDAIDAIRDTDTAFESAVASGLDEDRVWDKAYNDHNVADWIHANADDLLNEFGYKIVVKG